MINKVILVGNLGADPELRYTQAGTAVLNIRMATTEYMGANDDGSSKEHTEWHQVVVWGNKAETYGQHLAKGSKLYVEGRIRTNKWQDQNGNDRYTTEINADVLRFM